MGRLMEGENLANEPFLLAFCQTWYVLWLHGIDFLLRFHNLSEFGASKQEAFKQVVDGGFLLNRTTSRLFAANCSVSLSEEGLRALFHRGLCYRTGTSPFRSRSRSSGKKPILQSGSICL